MIPHSTLLFSRRMEWRKIHKSLMNIYLDDLLLLNFDVGCEDKLFIILFTKNQAFNICSTFLLALGKNTVLSPPL